MNSLSFSVFNDGNRPRISYCYGDSIESIYPKVNDTWLDDSLVKRCQNPVCSSLFGVFNRKHHCRACGYIYCGNCCSDMCILPLDLISVPNEPSSIKMMMIDSYRNLTMNITGKKLVCRTCKDKIDNLERIRIQLRICEYLTLDNLRYFTSYQHLITRDWYNAMIHYLSRFRNIQYAPIDVRYSKWECNILWFEREHLIKHESWSPILLKTALYYDYITGNNRSKILANIQHSNSALTCWNLMCSRRCAVPLDIIDIFSSILFFLKIEGTIEYLWKSSDVRDTILSIIKRYAVFPIPEYSIPLISSVLQMLSTSPLVDKQWILQILKVVLKGVNLFAVVSEYQYCNYKLILGQYLGLHENRSVIQRINMTISIFREINVKKEIPRNIRYPLLYPFDSKCSIVQMSDLTIFKSKSKPIQITLQLQSIDGLHMTRKIILKQDNDIRKESIVTSIITLLHSKLIQQSNLGRIDRFESIPTYRIYTIGQELGLVEYVESTPLESIGSIIQYLVSNNPTSTIDQLLSRFQQSMAISSSLAYILGFKDRHLGNILLTSDGRLFHIDYGYILDDPATSIFGSPSIKITRDMLDCIGGDKSDRYQQFRSFLIDIFDILRLYTHNILDFYYILSKDGILEWKQFNNKISGRFLRGLTHKDVDITLMEAVSGSVSSISSSINDIIHSYRIW